MNYNERELRNKPKRVKTLKQKFDEKSIRDNKVKYKGYDSICYTLASKRVDKAYEPRVIDRRKYFKIEGMQSRRY